MAGMQLTVDERIARLRRIDPALAVHLERASAHLASAMKHDEEIKRLERERERLSRLYGRRFILIRF
jgi:hypothetical protein